MIDFAQAWVGIFLVGLTWQMAGNFFVCAIVLMLLIWMVRQSLNKNSDIALADLFLDPVTRKIGTSTFRLNGAYVVTTFLYVVVVLEDKTQFVAATTVYAGLWVLDRARSSYFDNKKPPEIKQDAVEEEK